MSAIISNTGLPQGLSASEVASLERKFGKNEIRFRKHFRLLHLMLALVGQPMFIMLLVACSLYFILGETGEGIMMAAAMTMVAAISLYQDVKSGRALELLKESAEPKVKVIRDRREQVIDHRDLVPGDVLLLEEGMKIPADATVMQANDLYVNESIVTGESLPVSKAAAIRNNQLYQGTTVEGGKCVAQVTATGNSTVLGRIGKEITAYHYPRTVLQRQINTFVKRLTLFGLIGFSIILAANYFHYHNFISSLLFALTLAMSAVPEEIPVALSSFMALGAYQLSKYGIISRQPQVIENLGAVTVLCLDKTGTITENKMQLKMLYDFQSNEVIDAQEGNTRTSELLMFAALACEQNPFDSMEKAIVSVYKKNNPEIVFENYQMVHEYPLEGQPPMMTHIYKWAYNNFIAAAKGAPERIFKACDLNGYNKEKMSEHANRFASNGYRVLGVAAAKVPTAEFPLVQDNFDWQFMGLVALYDPPKANAKAFFSSIRNAGIAEKMVTGDFPLTAVTIAQEVGIDTIGGYMSGDEVMTLTEEELRGAVNRFSIFTRMFPDAKLKMVNALKANGEIVAMTGDGINDAPALNAADIGIAMGKGGTETARRASDLVLTDDNLDRILIAVSEGRRVFNNLLKSIRYIIAIHIPIILTASLPLLLGWQQPNIFTPVHIIFLELIMGPTCSIFFEKEPVEKNLMSLPPRDWRRGLFTKETLLLSIAQGITITAGVLALYYIFMKVQADVTLTRTIVFITLIVSNLLLTFTSRSFTQTLQYTLRYNNKFALPVIIISVLFLLSIQYVEPLRSLFQLTMLSLRELLICLTVALVSVMWFELYKALRKKNIAEEN